MLLAALSDDDLESTVHSTLTTYLEGTFTVLSNDLARVRGRPVSLTEANHALAADERWERAVGFVRAL